MPSRYPEAAFLSTVTAGVTHEMRNVLSIIKESAGLVGDLVGLHQAGRPLDPERVGRAVDRVDAQVRRGAQMLEALHRVAHAIDHDHATLDLDEELRRVVFLSQRRARIKGLTVQADDVVGKGSLRANPLHLQMALFSTLDQCIEALPEGTHIAARIHAEPDSALVEFWSESASESGPTLGPTCKGWKETQAEVAAVGGDLRVLDQGRGLAIRFGPV